MACGAMPGPPGCIIFSFLCFVIESEIAEREREKEERETFVVKVLCVCGFIKSG
jgi:hypothetical protein